MAHIITISTKQNTLRSDSQASKVKAMTLILTLLQLSCSSVFNSAAVYSDARLYFLKAAIFIPTASEYRHFSGTLNF